MEYTYFTTELKSKDNLSRLDPRFRRTLYESEVNNKEFLVCQTKFDSNINCNINHIFFMDIGDFSLLNIKREEIILRRDVYFSYIERLKTNPVPGHLKVYITLHSCQEHTKAIFLLTHVTETNIGETSLTSILEEFVNKFKDIYCEVVRNYDVCSRCLYGPKYTMTKQCDKIFIKALEDN